MNVQKNKRTPKKYKKNKNFEEEPLESISYPKSPEKIQRIIRQLLPLSDECDMNSKHMAMLISGGKPIISGYNHKRSCNSNQITLSFHAEMDVLGKYFNVNHEYSLRNFMNDSHYTLMGRRNQSYLLHQSEIDGKI